MSEQIMIESYDYQRVEKKIPFNLPTEAVYFFKTGSRVSVRVVPQWTTWNKKEDKEEEIWKLKMTLVYLSFKNKIETIDIQISHIPDIFKSGKGELFEILTELNSEYNIRTKEQFDVDLKQALKVIKDYGK